MSPDLHTLRRELLRRMRDAREAGGEIDVRLCYWPDSTREWETWEIRTGDVQYDTYHAPHCAAGTLFGECADEEIDALARDLLSQIEDSIAMTS